MIKKIIYIIWLFLFCLCIILGIKSADIRNFFTMMEDKTFDIRQSLMVREKVKLPNENIAIVAIDDATYEYILNNYGEWPLPRNVFADVTNFIEKQSPQSVIFDLMFVRSFKTNPNADKELIEVFGKYNNLYTSMNLDNQDRQLREPPILPDKLKVKVINRSPLVDFGEQAYTNCRKILDGIIAKTANIGMTNVSRSNDGVLRKVPPFVMYKGDLYPQLGMVAGLDYLKSTGEFSDRNFIVDTASNLRMNDRKIFLDSDGSAILNWYGGNETYEYIPLYKILKVLNGEAPKADLLNFKGKIVYIGTTAASLFDIKTVPVSKNYPGVELQATFINNLIDNNFIRRLDSSFSVQTGVLLALITILIVMNETSAFVGALASCSVYIIYIILTYNVMKYFNIWLDIVYPLLLAILTFIAAYMIKYILKSRDFDKQYILATTDGLTELYNHRYFQEHMRQMVEHSRRYETNFSMIILDIDFFKKFNDTYGHQSGDAVLKQVAQTLKKNIRSADIACRYGGEEMSIILANTNYETALITAEKICERISDKNFKLPNGKITSVTISLGVSTYPQDGLTAEELIEVADKRLYHAKANGRNQVGK